MGHRFREVRRLREHDADDPAKHRSALERSGCCTLRPERLELFHQLLNGRFLRRTETVDKAAHTGRVCIIFLLGVTAGGLAVRGVERGAPAMHTIEVLNDAPRFVGFMAVVFQRGGIVDGLNQPCAGGCVGKFRYPNGKHLATDEFFQTGSIEVFKFQDFCGGGKKRFCSDMVRHAVKLPLKFYPYAFCITQGVRTKLVLKG